MTIGGIMGLPLCGRPDLEQISWARLQDGRGSGECDPSGVDGVYVATTMGGRQQKEEDCFGQQEEGVRSIHRVKWWAGQHPKD